MRGLGVLGPLAALVVALAPAGCASGGARPGAPPSPAEVARLEARVKREPNDADAELRLAAAYQQLHRDQEARALLQRVVARAPGNLQAVLLLGVTREDQGDFAGARTLYERLLAGRTPARLRAELRTRLVLLQRRELAAAVRKAVTEEATLRNTPPRPRTLAIFPFEIEGGDSALQPLGRALTAMLITDLSQTKRLTVLDRVAVQMLADEIRLGQSGAVDVSTAARGGRLLGAARVLDGTVQPSPDRLQLDAAIVAMGAGGVGPAEAAPGSGEAQQPAPPAPGQRADGGQAGAARPGAPVQLPPLVINPPTTVAANVTAEDQLSHFFGLEKRFALQLYAALGIQLTPAERTAVLHRQTASLPALFAYGRGLLAEDAGDYATAERDFAEAVRLDPGFALARRQLATTRQLTAASQLTTSELAAQAMNGALRGGLLAAPPGPLPTMPFQRNPVTESLGTQGTAATTLIDIVIHRPGGTS